MYLSQNIKYLREQKGMTQRVFSESIGVSCAAVANWEINSRTPDIETIVQLAEYFRVSLDDLVLKDLRPPVPLYAINLAYLRKKHGMTQQEISELIGLKDKSSISLVESGKYDLSIENLEKLADFFGVTMDQIVKQDLSKEVM